MMTNARGQDHLITALRLQTLFKSAQQNRETGQSRNLSVLLQTLGADTSAAATGSINQNAIATARATAKIADWMTYLPKDCVKAMVNNGWHWST